MVLGLFIILFLLTFLCVLPPNGPCLTLRRGQTFQISTPLPFNQVPHLLFLTNQLCVIKDFFYPPRQRSPPLFFSQTRNFRENYR